MDPETPTVNGYLDEWLALLRTRVKPSTWHSYRTMAEAYIRPRLGEVRLDELTVRELDRFYVELLEGGRRRGGGPLSRRSVAYVHAIVHKALTDAVGIGLLAENVAAHAQVPRTDPNADQLSGEVVCWDEAQTRRFLLATRGQPLANLWQVALGTGMRRGELLGLRWDDVDLAAPQLRVSGSLTVVDGTARLLSMKTGRTRTLHLDEATAAAIARQPRRRGVNGFGLVFTRDDGTTGRRCPRRRCRIAGEPSSRSSSITTYLGSSCTQPGTSATLLLANGVPIKVVSQRLGHASIQMTMDIYAHVLPAMDRDAADAIGAAMGLGST